MIIKNMYIVVKNKMLNYEVNVFFFGSVNGM